MDHSILLSKLSKYGVRGISLKWFENYLNRRKQFIDNGHIKSKYSYLKAGVPQGSNLGPLLFLIYVNDLPLCLKSAQVTLFADDTTIYASANTNKELAQKMNDELIHLSEWFKCNKLTLNVNKSYGCIFGNDKNGDKVDFKIDNKQIEITGVVKYLGVYVDANLNWIPHIHNVANKVSQIIGVLAKIRHQ